MSLPSNIWYPVMLSSKGLSLVGIKGRTEFGSMGVNIGLHAQEDQIL